MDAHPSRPGKACLIYLMPVLLDMVLGLVVFVATVRVARLGGSATRVSSVLAVQSLVYVATSLLVGRFITPRNAHRLVLTGCLLSALVSGLLAIDGGYALVMVLLAISGLAAALFFVSFQIFMKDVDTSGGRPMTYSVGLYTFSWSTGLAAGPLVSGFIMQIGAPPGGGEGPGWRYAFLFGAAVALLLSLVQMLVFRERDRRMAEPAAAPAQASVAPPALLPDLAWLGWLGASAGFSAFAICRTVFASRAVTELHLRDGTLGTIFFTLCMSLALTGLALTRSRTWMYRPRPVLLFAVPGMLGLLCFGLGTHTVHFVAGAVLFGLYFGACCFYLVYHSLAHPEHAGRYVSVNEAVVGITGILAPLAGGSLADACGVRHPFVAAAALVFLVTIVQAVIHRRRGIG